MLILKRRNNRLIKGLLIIPLLFLFSGCGSMEAMKQYNFSTTKDHLETAVLKVIKSNPHIAIDTSQGKSIMHQAEFDSAGYASYIKGEVKIKISVGEIENRYTFRYLGDESYWKDSKTSAIFIQIATDKAGNALYQGQNDNGEFNSELAKEFTSLFEREVVDKIDKELKSKHTVD